jgi:hypothetical protein
MRDSEGRHVHPRRRHRRLGVRAVTRTGLAGGAGVRTCEAGTQSYSPAWTKSRAAGRSLLQSEASPRQLAAVRRRAVWSGPRHPSRLRPAFLFQGRGPLRLSRAEPAQRWLRNDRSQREGELMTAATCARSARAVPEQLDQPASARTAGGPADRSARSSASPRPSGASPEAGRSPARPAHGSRGHGGSARRTARAPRRCTSRGSPRRR